MTEHPIPTYQTTTFQKDDSSAIIYIALASLGALVVLLGAMYFLFFNSTDTKSVQKRVENEVAGSPEQNTTVAPTSTPTVTSTPTPTTTSTPTPTPTQEPQHQDIDTSYVYGYVENNQYKISDDNTKILRKSDNKVMYTAPTSYKIESFAVSGSDIFVVLKTPEAYTYDFRKVKVGSSNLGGLFYTYSSAYNMRSFVVDPKNYRTKTTYIIFDSISKKQFLVLKVDKFKETGKELVSAPNYAEFVEAYKLPDQDAISITYKTSAGETKTVIVNFGS